MGVPEIVRGLLLGSRSLQGRSRGSSGFQENFSGSQERSTESHKLFFFRSFGAFQRYSREFQRISEAFRNP